MNEKGKRELRITSSRVGEDMVKLKNPRIEEKLSESSSCC